MSPVLELRNVSAAYGANIAVSEVSFALCAGEAAALIGPNGAGKSTLLRTIVGLQPFSGQVEVAAEPLHPGTTQSVAYMPQRAHVRWDFPITALDVVLSGRNRFRHRLRRWTSTDRDKA